MAPIRMQSSQGATRRSNSGGIKSIKQQEQQGRARGKKGQAGGTSSWLLPLAAVVALGLGALVVVWKLNVKIPEDALIDWVKSKGGKFLLSIRTPKGGERGLYAARDINHHAVMATVPLSACVWLPATGSEYFEGFGLGLLEALGSGGYGPYSHALPMLHDDRHTIMFHNFPEEYLPLVGSHAWAEAVRGERERSAHFWSENGERLEGQGITQKNLRAAVVTAITRLITFRFNGAPGSVMVPVIDMANHRRGCPHYMEWGPCDFFRSGMREKGLWLYGLGQEEDGRFGALARDNACIFLRAGRALRRGEEVCLAYDDGLTPDQAFFFYGFNLPDKDTPLSALDEPLPSGDAVAERLLKVDTEPKRVEDGPEEALLSEVERLRGRIDMLDNLAKREAATPVAYMDKGGAALRGLGVLRRQRIQGMRAEVRRIQGILSGKRRA